MKEPLHKPKEGEPRIKPSLASALLIGAFIGLPLVAVLCLRNRMSGGGVVASPGNNKRTGKADV